MSFGNVADFQGDYVYRVVHYNTDNVLMTVSRFDCHIQSFSSH